MSGKSNLVDTCLQRVQEYNDAVEQLPQGDDFEYHSAFRGFRNLVEKNKTTTLDVIDTVIDAHMTGKNKIVVKDISANKGKHKAVMDSIDTLLENVDHLLDEAKGSRMHADQQQSVSFGSAPTSTQHQLAKPQLSFSIPVDNSPKDFQPLMFDSKNGKLTRGKSGAHPYEKEITSFSFPESQLQPADEQAYLDIDTTPFTFVETKGALEELAKTLAQETEIAVDLEHHSVHSFQGFTCLMQLSTRKADFVVDCIALRDDMWLLKSVFLDAKIVKVLHGAEQDIKWLQKDFGLYIANMFDTGIAMQTLRMPHSLFNVVDYFCQVKLDKKYQMADWRCRPLSGEMVMYARLDTHYLLYCYDRLRVLLRNSENQALGNLLLHVFQESRRLCLTRYEKPKFDAEQSYVDGMGASLGGLNVDQRSVVRALFNWRDTVARSDDESPPAVMHNSSILQLALKCPVVPSEVLKAIRPVTLAVRKRVNEIVDLIKANSSNVAVPAAVEADGAQTEKVVQKVRFIPQSGMLPSVERNGLPLVSSSSNDGEVSLTSTTPSSWFQSMMTRVPVREVEETPAAAAADSSLLPTNEAAAQVEEEKVEEEVPAHEEEEENEEPTVEEKQGGGDSKKVISLAEEYGTGRQTRRKAGGEVGHKRRR